MIKSDAKIDVDYAIVDVRDDDYVGGHIVGGKHRPSATFLDTIHKLLEETKDIPKIIFHCYLSQARYVCSLVAYERALLTNACVAARKQHE